MTDYAAARNLNRCPSHPGALLREVIPATGKSKAEIATLLGISRQHLYDILKERKPVSPATSWEYRMGTAPSRCCGNLRSRIRFSAASSAM